MTAMCLSFYSLFFLSFQIGNQNDQNIYLHRIDEETALHVHNGRETTVVEN